MSKSRLLLLISLILVAGTILHAQEKVTVNGVVKSAETGEPLFGAYVLTMGGVRLLMRTETTAFL